MENEYKANFTVEDVKPVKFRGGHITRMVLQSFYDYEDHCKVKKFLGKSVKLDITENPEQTELQGVDEKKEVYFVDPVMTCVKIESPAKRGGRVTLAVFEAPYEYEECTDLLGFIGQGESVRVSLGIKLHVESGEDEAAEPEETKLDIT